MISPWIQQYRFCGVGIIYDPLPNQDQALNDLMGDVPLVSISKTIKVGKKGKEEEVEVFMTAREGFNFSSYEFDGSLAKTIELNGNGNRISPETFWLDYHDYQRGVLIALSEETQERLLVNLRVMKRR